MRVYWSIEQQSAKHIMKITYSYEGSNILVETSKTPVSSNRNTESYLKRAK